MFSFTRKLLLQSHHCCNIAQTPASFSKKKTVLCVFEQTDLSSQIQAMAIIIIDEQQQPSQHHIYFVINSDG